MATAAATRRNGGRGSMAARVVAFAAWCVGVWSTQQFLTPMAGEGTGVLLAAILLQAVFTVGESPLWRGQGAWFNVLALAVDDVTNVGGIFFYLLKLDKTDSWKAFAQAIDSNTPIHPLAALVLSCLLGAAIAAAPEYLWRDGGK